MSALVNLAKFREEKLVDYVEGQKTAEELQQRIWELDDRKKSLVGFLSWSAQSTLHLTPPLGAKALNGYYGSRHRACMFWASAAQRQC